MKKVCFVLGSLFVSGSILGSFSLGYKDAKRNPIIVVKNEFPDIEKEMDIAGEYSIPNEDTHDIRYASFYKADYKTLETVLNDDNVDWNEEDVKNIMEASEKTGISPYLLFAVGKKESTDSTIGNKAKNKESTATGMYQFTEGTWLRTIKEHAAKHGMSNIADSIKIFESGISVKPKDRKQILNMRKDSKYSALFAAENFLRDKAIMESELKRKVTDGEIYLAHFLGYIDAIKFIKLAERTPRASAEANFPAAASGNQKIFKGKTVGQIKNGFEQYIQKTSLKYIVHFNKDKLSG